MLACFVIFMVAAFGTAMEGQGPPVPIVRPEGDSCFTSAEVSMYIRVSTPLTASRLQVQIRYMMNTRVRSKKGPAAGKA